MSFRDAKSKMEDYRAQQIKAMLGESGGAWFTSQWDSIGDILRTLSTDAENKAIASKYATAPDSSRVADHIRLDYVCALRRDIRKQYVSGDDDICTDVTAFRHGVTSAHGARIFDSMLGAVIEHAERQA